MALTKISTDTIDLSADTNALKMPKGTTAERQIEYLVVAGGGGGASNSNGGGGGGAGGLLSGTTDMIAATNLTITVGDGGTGAQNETSDGGDGDDSVFGNITATGGGGGGESQQDGRPGGSGGGASGDESSPYAIPGSGITQQGNNGGTGGNPSDVGGGGGGAGGVGQSGGAHNSSTDGQGGAALSNSITGTAVNYAGGGGGGVCDFVDNGSHTGQGQAVGSNAGGNGGVSQHGVDNYMNGDNGTTNTGSGGGGGSRSAGGTSATGGDGGDGIVILRYASKYTLVNNTPGTLSVGVLNGTVGDDKYTTFTAGTGTISGLNLDIAIGTMRENTTTGNMEIYTGAKGWRALQQTGQDVGVVPTNNFNTALYTGNAITRNIEVGFQPDLTWIKDRTTNYSNVLIDSVRGATYQIKSNTTDAQTQESQGLTAFTSTGFNLGTATGSYNLNNDDYVSWNWKAGGAATTDNLAAAGVTPTAGSAKIDGANATTALAGATPIKRFSLNTQGKFSITTFESPSASSSTIPHGLGVTPGLIIAKRTDSTGNWAIQAPTLGAGYLLLNTTAQYNSADSSIWNNTAANATVITIATGAATFFPTGAEFIVYSFASIPGYSLIGSYAGTGGTDFPIIYTGFAPAWLMIKRTDSTGNWCIYDNKRDTTNPNNAVLAANLDNAESYYASGYEVNFYNNGFQIAVGPSVDINADGGDYIFMCFAS